MNAFLGPVAKTSPAALPLPPWRWSVSFDEEDTRQRPGPGDWAIHLDEERRLLFSLWSQVAPGEVLRVGNRLLFVDVYERFLHLVGTLESLQTKCNLKGHDTWE